MITFNELLKRAKSEKIVVHTRTEEQAKALLTELDKRGYTWNSEDKLTTETNYKKNEENTCYSFYDCFGRLLDKKVLYCSLSFCQHRNYIIIECGDIEEMENNITRKNMTNREWLATLSNEDFVNWVYTEQSIFYDHRTLEVIGKAVYYPTLTEVTMGWNSYSGRLLQWLDEERKD